MCSVRLDGPGGAEELEEAHDKQVADALARVLVQQHVLYDGLWQDARIHNTNEKNALCLKKKTNFLYELRPILQSTLTFWGPITKRS